MAKMNDETVTEKAVRGQTLRTDTGPVRETSYPDAEAKETLEGRNMSGGPEDMSAALRGPAAFNSKK